MAVCQRARDGRDINKMVFDQILAVDDFLSTLPCIAGVAPRAPVLTVHGCATSVQETDAAA